MLLQNLSNTFSSWCSNKSFKMPFTSSGQVVEWRVLCTNRNLSSSAPNLPPEKRSLTGKEIKTKRMGGLGSTSEGCGQRDKGERGRTDSKFHNYLKCSSLSPSSSSVTWVITSESKKKTLSSPEGLPSLSVSILYFKNLNLKPWTKEQQFSGCSALLMYTQVCSWGTSDMWSCWAEVYYVLG